LVPLKDLKAQYHAIQVEVDAVVARTMESLQFVLGEAVAAEAAASGVLSLPMFPKLTEAQMGEVVALMLSRRFANARL
jgi:dTDP-4-amino-4,6-dideoxygalactose transaminase